MKEVWKLGSESATLWSRLNHYVNEIAGQIENGCQIALVLSGAIATANSILLDEKEVMDEGITPQMRATRGNAAFFSRWIAALDERSLRSGEFLVTHHELNYEPEGQSFAHTIEDYMKAGWVPLVNESGSTADEETRKLVYGGDNDGLAEEIADRIDAYRIGFLTETEGVLGRDGKVIEVVDDDNIEEVLDVVGEAGEPGPGAGMRTKVDAAWKAAGKGRTAHIAYAGYSFESIRAGKTGTLFIPRQSET